MSVLTTVNTVVEWKVGGETKTANVGRIKYLGVTKLDAESELQKKEDPERGQRKPIKNAIRAELKSGRKSAGAVKHAVVSSTSSVLRTVERYALEMVDEGELIRIPGKNASEMRWELRSDQMVIPNEESAA
jgi:hypothetical protein